MEHAHEQRRATRLLADMFTNGVQDQQRSGPPRAQNVSGTTVWRLSQESGLWLNNRERDSPERLWSLFKPEPHLNAERVLKSMNNLGCDVNVHTLSPKLMCCHLFG